MPPRTGPEQRRQTRCQTSGMKAFGKYAVAVLLTLGVCTAQGRSAVNSPSATRVTTTSSTPATPSTGPRSTTTTQSTTTTRPQPAADAVVQAFIDAGLPIKEHMTYDQATDENHQLGRPGQYTAKTSWHDGRLATPLGKPSFDVDEGGTIETFASHADRDRRAEYLRAFAESPPIGGYYMYVGGQAVLRVGFALTTDQAAQYAKVFRRVVGT